MPKDEFDFQDPLELNGTAFLSDQDTTNDMAECFTEEFMRMGYNHGQVLALFRNPHYLGPNMAFEKRGEPFIRDLIAEVFARRGKVVTWQGEKPLTPALSPSEGERENYSSSRGQPVTAGGIAPGVHSSVSHAETTGSDGSLSDPMGSPIPKVNL
jgi:hypothetical protein